MILVHIINKFVKLVKYKPKLHFKANANSIKGPQSYLNLPFNHFIGFC